MGCTGIPDRDPPVVTPPALSYVANSIGLHWAQMDIDHNAMLDMCGRLYRNGTPIAFILALGSPGNASPKAMKAVSPSTFVIYRHIEPNNWNCLPDKPISQLTYQDGFNWFEHVYAVESAQNAESLYADCWQLYNEWPKYDAAHPAVNEFNRGAMDAAYRRNRKITLYNFNPGFPAMPIELNEPQHDFWVRQATWNNLRQAIDQGHVLSVHGYDLYNRGVWTGEVDCLRHRLFLPLLPADVQQKLQIYYTEFGDALLDTVDSDTFVARSNGAKIEIRKDRNVRGVAEWTWGISGPNWKLSNAYKHKDAYEHRVMNA